MMQMAKAEKERGASHGGRNQVMPEETCLSQGFGRSAYLVNGWLTSVLGSGMRPLLWCSVAVIHSVTT